MSQIIIWRVALTVHSRRSR